MKWPGSITAQSMCICTRPPSPYTPPQGITMLSNYVFGHFEVVVTEPFGCSSYACITASVLSCLCHHNNTLIQDLLVSNSQLFPPNLRFAVKCNLRINMCFSQQAAHHLHSGFATVLQSKRATLSILKTLAVELDTHINYVYKTHERNDSTLGKVKRG